MFSTNLVLLSDQMAMQRSVDIVANNIANSSTTGFKREGIQFNTYLSQTTPKQSTSYVYDKATYRDTTPGTLSSTGNPLDLAIQGQGYFQIQTPQGTQYTRDGAFRTDNQGQIVNSSGMPVLSDGGQAITLPDDARDITISGDGFLTAQVGTGSSRAQLGKIGVVSFDNDQLVVPAGNGMLTTTQTPTPVLGNAIMQGAIEESNVKPVVEITDLIKLQRAYEQASNLIGSENTRLSDAIDKLSATQ
jgi:flagellar basal-body rod protein FlgF